jgi:hypothetical protein
MEQEIPASKMGSIDALLHTISFNPDTKTDIYGNKRLLIRENFDEWGFPIQECFLACPIDNQNTNYIIMMGKYNPLLDSFDPDALISVTSKYWMGNNATLK